MLLSSASRSLAAMRYDVIVIGGRCAGSPLAMLLARAGLSVLLVDKAEFPSDSINGHMIKPSGVARLMSWGLLEEVIATGAPPITSRRLVIGASVTEHRVPENAPAPIAPRRFALDQVLLEASRRAGAEVRTRTTLRGLLFAGERVVGARLLDVTGREQDVFARIVVGADGRNSLVARRAGARLHRDDGTTSICYWSYWRGITPQCAALYLTKGLAAGLVPTNDGLAVAWVQAPADAAQDYRSDPARQYLRAVRQTPIIGGLLSRAGASREGRMLGMLSLPNFIRQAHGPGWALVGDAAHHKDPLAARGISDAFRDAELLAQAVEGGLGGTDADLTTELARYQRARDDANGDVYEANLEFSRLDRSVPELPALFGSVAEAEAVADSSYPPLARFGNAESASAAPTAA